MILSSILPGLRDLRLPLSVGLTWLAAAWFALRSSLPPRDTTSGVFGSVYELVKLIGQAGSLSVLIFTGYLLGALLTVNVARQVPLSWLLKGAPFDRSGYIVGAFNPLDPGRVKQLEIMISGIAEDVPYSSPLIDREVQSTFGTADDTQGQLTRSVMTSVVAETPSLADQLQLNAPGRFEAYDRRQSEAEFRQAIAFPLVGLCLVLSWVGTPLVLMSLVPIVALWFQGVRRAQAARSFLISGIVEGTQESMTIERVRTLFGQR